MAFNLVASARASDSEATKLAPYQSLGRSKLVTVTCAVLSALAWVACSCGIIMLVSNLLLMEFSLSC